MRSRPLFRSSFFRAAMLQIAFLAVVFPGVGFADEASTELIPRGTIVDTALKPIPGAQITLHRWDGVMSPPLQKSTTDAAGHFGFRPGKKTPTTVS